MKRSNLQHSILQPRNELKQYVRRILITHGDDNTDEIMPIVPTGFAYLTYSRYPVMFSYNERNISTDDKYYLVGQLEHEKPAFSIKGKFFHVGLELYPLVPFYAFGITGEKLTDTGLISNPLYELVGRDTIDRVEKQDSAEIVAEKLQLILVELLRKPPLQFLLEKCLEEIYASRGNIPVNELAERLDISERSLRRQFKEYVGIGIKKYEKTIQFNSVFETISNGNHEEIYRMALEHGFYDHAHFINFFTELLGTSPQKFINNPDDFLLTYLSNAKQKIE